MEGPILVLSGGVGGAKLVRGLVDVLAPEEMLVVANTGDDFVHWGLTVCPDIDSICYALADLTNPATGWGQRDETWEVMAAMKRLGGPTWFQLGDRDLATHARRSDILARGESLTEATRLLCKGMGIDHRVVPMTEDQVATRIRTPDGQLDFQEYFVAERCEPTALGVEFAGAETARPQHDFLNLLTSNQLAGVIVCPSNPFLSLDPILALPEIRAALRSCKKPIVAVAPIIGGKAVKGPTAKLLVELGHAVTAAAVAAYYADFMNGYLIDEADADCVEEIGALGIRPQAGQILMETQADKVRVAQDALRLLDSLA